MTEPIVLSGSSLNTFLRCGHQWYLAYVVQLRQPPNVRMALGIAAHAAIEHNMAQKVVTKRDVSVTEMTEVFSDNFDAATDDIEDPDEPLGSAKDDGVKLVQLHRAHVSPAIQPVWVEEAGQLAIDGIPYSWTIDIADDRGRIRDTKTSKYKPDLEKHMLQMTGYALGFRQRTGQEETEVVIDGLVRTKVPYYAPLYGPPASPRRVDSFVEMLHSVNDGIAAGSFQPNGLNNGACNWCGYASVCKYRKR